MALDSNPTLASRPVKEVYAVSRLVREAKGVLEGSFPLTWVEGEISNLAMPASGHIYFTLKDEVAQVRCAMFRTRNRHVRFTPKNGVQVLLRVRVTLYEGRGEFQCVVEHMEEAGSGALQRAYDALKHRLGDEGLFDSEHKKSLPTAPQRIGVISSPDGAAVHDILTVLQRRFPAAHVILYPVAVQGTDSAKQISSAIKLADKRNECDVLIVGRGGGSLEDLWSFNDEQLARSIFACKLPIISAVGHEVDFTIADFVADVRAATPSAAAELAVPDGLELLNKVNSFSQRLLLTMKHLLQAEQNQLKLLQQRLDNPLTTISQNMQNVDRIEQQLHRAWRQIVKDKQQQVDYWSVRLTHPQAKIDTQRHRLQQLAARLDLQIKKELTTHQFKFTNLSQRFQALPLLSEVQDRQAYIRQVGKRLATNMQLNIDRKAAQLSSNMRTLAAVSPLSTLERGYSITTSLDTNEVLLDSENTEVGQQVNVRLQKGQLQCKIVDVKND